VGERTSTIMDFLYSCSQSRFDMVRDRVNVTKFSESARKHIKRK